jgi:hypothetical protein
MVTICTICFNSLKLCVPCLVFLLSVDYVLFWLCTGYHVSRFIMKCAFNLLRPLAFSVPQIRVTGAARDSQVVTAANTTAKNLTPGPQAQELRRSNIASKSYR